MCEVLTPTTLQMWLEWAGARLIAMPGGHIGPRDTGVFWPEYDRDRHEVLQFRGRLRLRAVAPNKDEIAIVDEILLLPNLCSEIRIRRVLHVRSLVHPLNGRHLYPWRRIAKLLATDHKQIKRWHVRGLEEVTAKADPAKVCLIAQSVAGTA